VWNGAAFNQGARDAIDKVEGKLLVQVDLCKILRSMANNPSSLPQELVPESHTRNFAHVS